jgi:endonuclease-3 related protein
MRVKEPTRKPELIDRKGQIRACFLALQQAWGPQHWWPAKTPFEVIVGAYLTQNTSWTNVEKALNALRAAGSLSAAGVRQLPLGRLEKLIRPSGYFRQKAQRLKTFIRYLDQNYRGSLKKMFGQPTEKLRTELLSLNGVGPETADSILLYAGLHPVFVVDAYTRRVFERHEIIPATASYDEIRLQFEEALAPIRDQSLPPLETEFDNDSFRPPVHPPSTMSQAKRSTEAQIYAEMHGLIVQAGKHFCLKKAPRCKDCPLRFHLPLTSPLREKA